MEWFQWFTVLYYSVSIVCLVLFFYTWKQRKQPGGLFLSLLLLSIVIWLVTQGTEYLVLDLSTKILFSKISYIGILTVTLFFFECVYSYVQKIIKWNHLLFAFLCVVPVVLFFFVITNGTFHNLLWPSIDIIPGTNGHLLEYHHGIIVTISAIYSYGLAAFTVLLLLYYSIHTEATFRHRYYVLIVACFLPWIGNALYIGNWTSVKGIDFTPLGFAFSSILLYLVIFKYKFLDVKPIAYDYLLQNQNGYSIVLDDQDRIVMVDPSAKKDLHFPSNCIGKPFSVFTTTHPTIASAFRAKDKSVIYQENILSAGNHKRKVVFYELTKTPLKLSGSIIGTLLHIEDISSKMKQQEDLRLRNKLQESLIQTSKILLSNLENWKEIIYSMDPLQEAFNADFISIVRYHPKRKNGKHWSNLAEWKPKKTIPSIEEKNSEDIYPLATPLYELFDLRSMSSLMNTLEAGSPYVFHKPSLIHSIQDRRMEAFLTSNNVVLIPLVMQITDKGNDANTDFINRPLWGYMKLLRKEVSSYADQSFNETEIKIMKVLVSLFSEYLLRKQIQNRLVESKERFEQVVNQAREIIWETDKHNNITYASNTFYKVFSIPNNTVFEKFIPKDVFVGSFLKGKSARDDSTTVKNNLELADPQFRDQLIELSEKTKARKVFRDFLFKAFDMKGNLLYFLINAIPVFDKDNNYKGYRGSAFDITLIKQLEIMKDSFINTVSHEFRTPLFAIRESINIVKKQSLGDINPMQKNALDISLRNTDRLVRLINDILDYQKFQSGRFAIKASEVSARTLIQEAFFSIEPLTEQKGLLLQKAIASDCPKLMVDKDMIVQVLINLLGNGLKFTSQGGLLVRAYPDFLDELDVKNIPSMAYEGKNQFVHMEIEDTGIGIKKEDLPKLFQTFSQISSKDQPKTEGTGLGLVISKQIIDMHKGKIWVESIWGKGTTFHLLLPVK